jgi:hypothetical protein
MEICFPNLQANVATPLKPFFSRHNVRELFIAVPPSSISALAPEVLDVECVKFGLIPPLSFLDVSTLPKTLVFDYPLNDQ